MPETKPTNLANLVGRLLAEGAGDAMRLAKKMQGGELTTDAVDVPKAKYDEFNAEHWSDPNERMAWNSRVKPEKFLNDALNVAAPDLAPPLRSKWMELLAAGVDPMEATRVIQAQHQAAQLIKEIRHPSAATLGSVLPPSAMPTAPMAPPPPPIATAPPAPVGFAPPPPMSPGGMV